MKNWSIKSKLILLSTSLLAIMLTVGGAGFVADKNLIDELDYSVQVTLPAVRAAGLADMMHDGIRATAYDAILFADTGGEEKKKALEAEIAEMTKNLTDQLEIVVKLNISEETNTAVKTAQPAVAAYVKSGHDIVTLALGGHKDLALAKVNDFQTNFEALEVSLGAVGEIIEKNAEESQISSQKKSQNSVLLIAGFIALGIIVGIALSWFLINDLVKTLSGVISQLTSSSNEVSSASQQSARSATSLSEASTEQAASLQETMASVEEISAMVSQNAESASKVKKTVDNNQVVSEDGSKSVDNMIRAIDEIKSTNDRILNQMEESNKEFGQIVKIISEIGDKTKVINDIVFQTKLLSFNASVEAARAGEHGKGFAVVAEEVGNLAQMSGNAAKEITDMLSGSIKKVNEIVELTTQRVDQLVEIGKDKITMGQSTAAKCREALTKISENAGTVAAMVNEITNASKEQAQGIQEINKAISQLDQVTQQNSAVAQTSSTQAEQLRGESHTLSQAVNSLVEFVNGRGDSRNEHQGNEEPEFIAPVVKLNTKKNKKIFAAVPHKKVANGGDEVPSSSDPEFEEF